MTLNDALLAAYAWGVAHGGAVLAAGLVIPVIGTLAARAGKAGRTDEDGRVIASLLLGIGVLAMVGELIAIHVAHAYFGGDVLAGDVRLLLAPIVCLGGCLLGVRLVFPFSELAGARTLADLGLLVLACWGVLWFFSKFRGWGILFFGSFLQLVVVLVIAGYFMRRLFLRAFHR